MSHQTLSNEATTEQRSGAITTATHNVIQGFAKNNLVPEEPISLDVYIDNTFYFKFIVNDKNVPEGEEHLFFPHHDFYICCDLPLRALKLSIRFAKDGKEIENSPVYLNYDGKPVTLFIENHDEYIEETRKWLDERFDNYTNGIYNAHQPIYGYRSGYCEPNLFDRYLITFHIMNALSRLSFKTLLDVGGAEGYKAAMAAKFFEAQVVSSDVSQVACNRAYELYGIETALGNMHSLPFEDGQFDVVLCSEALEHVPDFKKSLKEVLRVCKKAAIITIPHESQETVKNTIERGETHGHIQYFDVYSFEYLKQLGYGVFIQKILLRDQKLLTPAILMECYPPSIDIIDNKSLKWLAKRVPWLMRLIFNKFVVAPILEQDVILKKRTDLFYGDILAIIVKDKKCLAESPKKQIRMREVMDFTVPFLRKKKNCDK
ncbi:class I SAM-dependent methyltransferase [Candidatus Parabeggiatoa sp. HSG14]|uniref:class I SAM-dependent methyltransferase n=1 Tax=Candidatus Parabeggiatoa sp. HSG14 TaxID=3055593 RepID=UPI0025A72B21|nr:class I SAM-dependent methyltransferase [Thiotrichales bacterium HSG14]